MGGGHGGRWWGKRSRKRQREREWEGEREREQEGEEQECNDDSHHADENERKHKAKPHQPMERDDDDKERPSAFVAGRYLKFSRRLSQSPWTLADGERMGDGSVQECITRHILPLFSAPTANTVTNTNTNTTTTTNINTSTTTNTNTTTGTSTTTTANTVTSVAATAATTTAASPPATTTAAPTICSSIITNAANFCSQKHSPADTAAAAAAAAGEVGGCSASVVLAVSEPGLQRIDSPSGLAAAVVQQVRRSDALQPSGQPVEAAEAPGVDEASKEVEAADPKGSNKAVDGAGKGVAAAAGEPPLSAKEAQGARHAMQSRAVQSCAAELECKFQAAGREDIDVRMLGTGRPFLMEVKLPRRIPSREEVEEAARRINSLEAGRVGVRGLRLVGREVTAVMREGEGEKQKSYAALVVLSRPFTEEDKRQLEGQKDLVIHQHTPIRVLHRRAPLVRPRTIFSMRCERTKFSGNGALEDVSKRAMDNGCGQRGGVGGGISGRMPSNHFFTLHLTTQAGTYVKEFVHGDFGRTKPNVGDLLGCEADILELDVTDIKMDFLL